MAIYNEVAQLILNHIQLKKEKNIPEIYSLYVLINNEKSYTKKYIHTNEKKRNRM
jgi:hypothetical protein